MVISGEYLETFKSETIVNESAFDSLPRTSTSMYHKLTFIEDSNWGKYSHFYLVFLVISITDFNIEYTRAVHLQI